VNAETQTPPPFNCRRCDDPYTPAPDQWIFYKLCDECFTEFDQQKVRGRFGGHPEMFRDAPPEVLATMGITDPETLATRPSGYYESATEWIAAVGKKLRS
jgi:hypothetical protein